MKSLRLALVAGLAGAAAVLAAPAADPSTAADASSAHPVVPDHRSQQAVAALKLSDPALAARVLDVVSAHAAAVDKWHVEHGAEAKALWDKWWKARAKHDSAAALAPIDALYATFKPEHDRFLAGLGALLDAGQVAVVEDRIIDKGHKVGRLETTYGVYQQEFPSLTEAQKAVVLAKLEAARTDAVDAMSSSEKASIFKRRKDEIEAYLGSQGYDAKGMISEFGQKGKAEMAAKKRAASAKQD